MEDDYYDDCYYSDDSQTESSEDSSDSEDSQNTEDDNDFEPEIENVKIDDYIGAPYLTKFEKTRVLGVRAEQIAAGGKIFVETDETDPLKIAILELNEKKMPLIIRRYFGKVYKDISVNSLS